MHEASDKGGPGGASKKAAAMSVTDNEIKEKYLERAIRELNQLSRELKSCEACSRTNVMPVLGSGHPQADIFLVKYAPTVAEIEEARGLLDQRDAELRMLIRQRQQREIDIERARQVLAQRTDELRRELAEDPPVVLGIEHKLQQVFLNLFLNARDAIDGVGVVRVEVRPARADGPRWPRCAD